MQLAGKVIHVFPAQTFETKSGEFTKRAIVIRDETDPKYPQEIKVDVTGKALDYVPEPGTMVTAHIDVRGREYKRKDTGERDWFTSLNCWKIDTGDTTTTTVEVDDVQDVPF